MSFEELAVEMLTVRANLLQVPVHQKVSKMMRGTPFVLYYLYSSGGQAHPNELSKNLSVSTARIARLLNYLEERNMITRSADPQNGKFTIVHITQEGKENIEQMCRDVVLNTAKMLEALGLDDAQAYIRIQKKIIQIYSEGKC